MQGDDKLSARSSIQRLRLPRPFAWAALAFLSLALALVVFVVRAQPRVGTQVLSTESGLVREFLDEQDNLLLVLSTILAVLGLWALRRLRFAQLIRKPGPVEILQFVTGQGTEAPVENIVAHFSSSVWVRTKTAGKHSWSPGIAWSARLCAVHCLPVNGMSQTLPITGAAAKSEGCCVIACGNGLPLGTRSFAKSA